jgi:hypothetical protein
LFSPYAYKFLLLSLGLCFSLSSCEAVVFAFQQLFLLPTWIHMGLEDQVGEALQAPVVLEAPEVLEGGVQFLLEVLEALEALEDGALFLLEGLGSRVALGLVASWGPGKLDVQLSSACGHWRVVSSVVYTSKRI